MNASRHSPLVTVYIPTRNRIALLRRAIQSVLRQTHQNFELIVVDDCSFDATPEELENLAHQDGRIRVIRNSIQAGACIARNTAIEKASGKFITGLDDDDFFEPDRLEDFVTSWASRPPGTVALCSARARLQPGSVIRHHRGPARIELADMYLRNQIGSQVYLPTSLARDIGGFDPKLKAWQDYDFLLRLLNHGPVTNTQRHTYVVDTSHDFERISTARFDTIKESCEYLIAKHGLKGTPALRVRSQLLVYQFRYSSAMCFALQFLLAGDIAGLKAVIMRAYRAAHKRPTPSAQEEYPCLK